MCAFLAIVSCDGHEPRGILVEKEYNEQCTIMQFSPATHTYIPHTYPSEYIFKVECDVCGQVHSCHVEKFVFDKYNVGDSLSSKGRYYGEMYEENE